MKKYETSSSLLDLMGDAPLRARRWAENSGAVAYFVPAPGPVDRAIAQCRFRLGLAMAMFVCAILVIAAKIVDVSVLSEGARGRTFQVARHAPPTLGRADIVDRNGMLLATNLSTSSVYANPKLIDNPKEVARSLKTIFPDLSLPTLVQQLSGDRSFVWIRRNISPRQQFEVNKLGVPGLNFQKEEQRVYPQGSMLAHVLGYMNVDNHGIAGLEKTLDPLLTDTHRRDEPMALAVDLRVQHALVDVLSRGITKFSAKGGVGLVVDAHSGEILALASLPDFDPHHPNATGGNGGAGGAGQGLFNRASLGVYEMGSTFKSFTVAMALDSGKVKLGDQFDARFPIKFARFDIRDTHPQARFLSVPEVFMYSSNIGTVKIAETMGVQTQREYFKRLGFLSPVDVELPERGQPIFPEPWREIHMMTASFGHGIAVSPLHLVRATAAVVNGGTLPTLTLLKKKETTKTAGKQVLKPETSQAMRGLLRQVVMQGTGKSADVPGYQVGGKTGTAEKSHNGGYNRKAVLTTFVGSFPMNDPRYVTLMLLDEPQSTPQTHGYITAGWNVAPLTAELIERIAPMLGVMPEAPEKVQEVVYQGDRE